MAGCHAPSHSVGLGGVGSSWRPAGGHDGGQGGWRWIGWVDTCRPVVSFRTIADMTLHLAVLTRTTCDAMRASRLVTFGVGAGENRSCDPIQSLQGLLLLLILIVVVFWLQKLEGYAAHLIMITKCMLVDDVSC